MFPPIARENSQYPEDELDGPLAQYGRALEKMEHKNTFFGEAFKPSKETKWSRVQIPYGPFRTT